jgi:hypothetical protein
MSTLATLRRFMVLLYIAALSLLLGRLLPEPFLVLPFLDCVQHVVPQYALM